MSGTGYQTEYQYLGMENDGFAYYGGNRYYSPVMGRFLSLSGPLSSAGGFGSGVGPVAAAMGAMSPSGSGFNPAFDPREYEYAAAGAWVGSGVGIGLAALEGLKDGAAFGWVGAAIGAGVGAVAGLFQDLFSGGSSGPPGWIVWKLNHQGGNLQLWAQIDGIDPALAPSWMPSADVPSANAPSPHPSLGEPHYWDFNVTGGYGVGVTFGVQVGAKGCYYYAGGGAVTPGFGVSAMKGSGEPTPGLNFGFQAQANGVGGQIVVGPDGKTSVEGGIGGPAGASITGYYVSGPDACP